MSTRRLDTVLRIRSLQERLAKGEVMARRLEQHRCEQEAARARSLVAERAALDAPTVSASNFVAHRSMLGAGTAQADRACVVAFGAREEVAIALESWTEASQRLDGVERLDERATAEALFEQQRVDCVELDDLVVMRWGRS